MFNVWYRSSAIDFKNGYNIGGILVFSLYTVGDKQLRMHFSFSMVRRRTYTVECDSPFFNVPKTLTLRVNGSQGNRGGNSTGATYSSRQEGTARVSTAL